MAQPRALCTSLCCRLCSSFFPPPLPSPLAPFSRQWHPSIPISTSSSAIVCLCVRVCGRFFASCALVFAFTSLPASALLHHQTTGLAESTSFIALLRFSLCTNSPPLLTGGSSLLLFYPTASSASVRLCRDISFDVSRSAGVAPSATTLATSPTVLLDSSSFNAPLPDSPCAPSCLRVI